MGKEFIEYHSENGKIPYSTSTLCYCLTQYAKDYILENRITTSYVDKKVRDAVLVDAINYLGVQGCLDFALYTEDLYDAQVHEEKVDPQCLLTVIVNHFAYHMFNEGIVESVLRSKHMNECTEPFDANDGATVLLDFINYIAKRNGYDRTFTIKELYEKYKVFSHKIELKKLKDFIKLANEYNNMFASGVSIDSVFRSKSRTYDLMNIEENIYAMAYAYVKMEGENKQPPKTEIINQKIIEMKQK